MTTSYPAVARPILSHRPKRFVKLPSYPSTEDELWFSAFCLGRDGVEADPPGGLSNAEQTAWLDGYGCGAEQRDADREESFHEELDRIEMAARNRDQWDAEGGGL